MHTQVMVLSKGELVECDHPYLLLRPYLPYPSGSLSPTNRNTSSKSLLTHVDSSNDSLRTSTDDATAAVGTSCSSSTTKSIIAGGSGESKGACGSRQANNSNNSLGSIYNPLGLLDSLRAAPRASFASMVAETGEHMAAHLVEVAYAAWMKKSVMM